MQQLNWSWLEPAWELACGKTTRNAGRFGGCMPNYTVEGRYQLEEDGGWTGGFWTGMLWRMYERTREERYLLQARSCQERLSRRLERPETLDHDTGYLFGLSCAVDYRLTGHGPSRDIALQAASHQRSLFHEKSGAIRSWTTPVQTEDGIVRAVVEDGSLLNLGLLFWAAGVTGDRTYSAVAVQHAETVRRHNIREDFSAYNTFLFADDTGQPLFGRNFQGLHDESCWSRGAAYQMYGFSNVYRHTGDARYLETARGMADAILRRLGGDYLPLWDFDDTGAGGQEKDSAAAAVLAAALLALDALMTDRQSARYRQKAIAILQNLYERVSTREDPAHEGLLLHGCGCHKDGLRDSALIYGDYFFVEALSMLSGGSVSFW